MSVTQINAVNSNNTSVRPNAAPVAFRQTVPQTQQDAFEKRQKTLTAATVVLGLGTVLTLVLTVANRSKLSGMIMRIQKGSSGASSVAPETLWKNCSKKSTPTLDELAGMTDVKKRLKEFVKVATTENQSPALFKEGSLKNKPLGFIMSGPSGTGKTYIAESFAKTMDADIIKINSSDIVTSLVGEAEKNFVKVCSDIVERAKADPKKQLVVFFDELEGLFRSRTAGHATEHNSKMVNTILQEMDNLKAQNLKTNNVTIIGTTNIYENLDSAVRTRLSNINVGLPDKDSMAAVLEAQLKQRLVIADKTFDYNKLAATLENKQVNMREIEDVARNYTNWLALNKNDKHNAQKLEEIITDFLKNKRVD